MEEVQTGSGPAQLVRVRNPWGGDRGRRAGHAEWTGEYSDGHVSWQDVTEVKCFNLEHLFLSFRRTSSG